MFQAYKHLNFLVSVERFFSKDHEVFFANCCILSIIIDALGSNTSRKSDLGFSWNYFRWIFLAARRSKAILKINESSKNFANKSHKDYYFIDSKRSLKFGIGRIRSQFTKLPNMFLLKHSLLK